MATDSLTKAGGLKGAGPGKHLGGPWELYGEIWRLSAGKRGSILLALTLLVAGISVKLALPYLAAQASGGSYREPAADDQPGQQ